MTKNVVRMGGVYKGRTHSWGRSDRDDGGPWGSLYSGGSVEVGLRIGSQALIAQTSGAPRSTNKRPPGG